MSNKTEFDRIRDILRDKYYVSVREVRGIPNLWVVNDPIALTSFQATTEEVEDYLKELRAVQNIESPKAIHGW